MSRPRLPRENARCQAILLTKDALRPFRRCEATEVLAFGYCRDHSYPASAVERYDAMWQLLGPDWADRQEQLALQAAPRDTVPEGRAARWAERRLRWAARQERWRR